jgi:hypothetical protein
MHKKTLQTLLFTAVLSFSLGARAQVMPYIADYGVPLAAETTIEIIKECLGKGFWGQWALGLLQLQNNNIQNGFSKHLQDKVASGAQSIRNGIHASVKSENAADFLASMNQLRSASQKAHSTESIKSRMNMAQWLPILESLYELASHQKDPEDSARIIAYAVFIIGTFLPEFSAKDPEVFSKPYHLFKIGKLHKKQTLQAAEAYRDWTNNEPSLQARLEKIIHVWATGEGNTEPLGVSETIDWMGYGIFAAGLLLPPAAVGSFKNEIIRGSLVQALNGNIAESLTRVNMMKLAADTRLSVQQLGMPLTNHSSSVSFEAHQQRQFTISKTWSELGLTMRANLWRYLAILVPDLVKIAQEPNVQNRAAMFASVLSYLRQYDPEYPIDDRFMRMSIRAVLGGYAFANTEFQEALEGNLRWLDPGYNTHQEVRDYYQLVLSPSDSSTTLRMPGFVSAIRASGLPVFSFAISWGSEGINSGLKVLFGYAKWPAFFKETYDRVLGSIIRGVGDPVKNDIQQSINDATRIEKKSNAEVRLSSGSVEMNGRLGPDAQMSRAIYERLLPTFSHILDSAREAYQAEDPEQAAGLIIYLADLIATIYPEAPANDPLIASLIKTRFSQFVDLDILESAILKALPTNKPVLSCFLTQRFFTANLLTENCIPQEETSWTWSGISAQAMYWSVMGAGFLLPGAFAWAKGRYGNNFENIPWAARKLSLASLSLVVTSVFNGITKGLMDWSKSIAQRTAQRALISDRVDESENTGRAHEFFSARQWELQKHLPLNPQEARKDLVVILPNWALNFRKTVPDYTTFEEFLKTPLGLDYAEGKEALRPFFERIKKAFKYQT